MSLLTSGIRLDSEYTQLLRVVEQDFRVNPLPILASGLCDGAADALIVSLLEDTVRFRQGAALMICPEEKDCVRMCGVLERFGLRGGFFMGRDLTFYNMVASHEYEHERIKVLSGLLNGDYDVILTTPDAALGYTVPPAFLKNNTLRVNAFEELELGDFIRKLCEAGYVRVDLVDSPGQFAVRGGILDVYPPYGSFLDADGGMQNGAYALRVELFGEEIDRMGLFEPETQRMTQTVEAAEFPPARELICGKETLERLKKAITAQHRATGNQRACEELLRERAAVDAALSGSAEISFLDKYITLIYPESATLLDYFTNRRLMILKGTNAINERLQASEWHMNQTVTELLEGGTIAPKYAEYRKPSSEFQRFCDRCVTLHVDSIAYRVSDKRLAGLFGFRTRHTVSYADNNELFLEDLRGYVHGGYRCLVLAENAVAAEQISQLLREEGYELLQSPVSVEKMPSGSVAVLHREFLAGYELPVPRVAVLSINQDARAGSLNLAGKSILRKKKKQKSKSILSYAELEVGDYVVHEAYGIGQFTGIETITSHTGVTRDYVGIRYAGTDRLLLPIEKLDKLGKYIGAHADDGLVKLSKMGGEAWKKSKTRAKSAVREMAKDLIRLYAERMRLPGHVFPADDAYQKAFEDAFEYEETESQITAVNEIKEDMMKAAPMDRLLCGDVGYGKTEVALRAAYKAVLGGKQVAVLVPTTLLALQHYQTMLSRMRSFAVNVDMISRFRTPKQQAQTLRRLKRGEVDILVGTHRILSKDVEFHDLGLVIVDEEQRFGVAQKEKLKQATRGVDVLSLSATPIPRTLNMAMGGIRDISILDDAPVDRLPIQTYVLEEEPLIIEEAIRRELRRGGQVFYLHNNVETVYSVAAKLASSIPEARITVGHGKMDKDELEKIWEQMLAGEIDILVCTTIIETGVDIPNANTLIVSNAHKLGLSQLHQIRGRVGRSSRRAYAYFTFPAGRELSEIARKRLEAVREYAEFGAGFKIALRDMELRGTGNLLGSEQHGHLDAIGYDLYIKLLNQAILEEKGEAPPPDVECTVSLDFSARIPESYVPYPAQRMALYKKIALIANEADLMDVTDELVDRFGEPPVEARNLLRISLIHSTAVACGITSLRQEGTEIRIYPQKLDIDRWMEVSDRLPDQLRIRLSGEGHLCLRLQKKEQGLERLQACLTLYSLTAPTPQA
ncbi:MAG: transcription-repair coupling factor [Ruminococcaceae bacterium]|nr:transcription-repair coupling factor [Oscillospiraceae bacterium]